MSAAAIYTSPEKRPCSLITTDVNLENEEVERSVEREHGIPRTIQLLNMSTPLGSGFLGAGFLGVRSWRRSLGRVGSVSTSLFRTRWAVPPAIAQAEDRREDGYTGTLMAERAQSSIAGLFFLKDQGLFVDESYLKCKKQEQYLLAIILSSIYACELVFLCKPRGDPVCFKSHRVHDPAEFT